MKKIILAIAVLFPIILFGQSRTFNLSTFDGYTKTQLQTSGRANIDWGNLKNVPNTVINMLDSASMLNVKNFGAKGDSVTNDYSSINNAISAAKAQKKVLIFPEGSYKINTRLTQNDLDKSSSITMIGQGNVTLDFSAVTGTFIDFRSTISDTNSILSDINKGDTVITVDMTGLTIVKNDIIELRSTYQFGGGASTLYKKGEIVKVKSVSGNNITLYEPTFDSYDSETGWFYVINAGKISINNMKFKGSTSVTTGSGLYIKYMRDLSIRDVVIVDSYADALELDFCYSGVIDNVSTTETMRSGQGYGIAIESSQKINIINCKLYAARHGISCGGLTVSRQINISNNFISLTAQYARGSGIDAHGNCEYIAAIGNQLKNCGFGFRNPNFIIKNNIIWNGDIMVSYGEYWGKNCDFQDISGNIVTQGGILFNNTSRRNTVTSLKVVDNTITNPSPGKSSYYGIGLFSISGLDSNYIYFKDVDISNNTINDQGSYSYTALEIGTDSIQIDQLKVNNNIINTNTAHGIALKSLANIGYTDLTNNTIVSGGYAMQSAGFSKINFSNNYLKSIGSPYRGTYFNHVGNLFCRNNIAQSLTSSRCFNITSLVDTCYLVDNIKVGGDWVADVNNATMKYTGYLDDKSSSLSVITSWQADNLLSKSVLNTGAEANLHKTILTSYVNDVAATTSDGDSVILTITYTLPVDNYKRFAYGDIYLYFQYYDDTRTDLSGLYKIVWGASDVGDANRYGLTTTKIYAYSPAGSFVEPGTTGIKRLSSTINQFKIVFKNLSTCAIDVSAEMINSTNVASITLTKQ